MIAVRPFTSSVLDVLEIIIPLGLEHLMICYENVLLARETTSHFVTSRNNNRLRNHPLKLLPYSCELMLGTGYRFSFQTCAFRLAAMLTQIIYGIRSPPAIGDTPKNKMMLTSMAIHSNKIRAIPPLMDLSPKKITDHSIFRAN